jgi:3-deoxy-manno-octulosonate cytidylyltransferase (CMP-KDO synthetase)
VFIAGRKSDSVPVAAIIPARYASVRFPGKPLARQTGKPLIQHVYEQVRAARRVDRVLVATDDARIAEAVQGFGGEAVMTRADHVSGTDRVAEAARGIDADLIVNVQGDEPEMDPAAVGALVTLMDSRPDAPMGSLACRFVRAEDVRNPACVKVILDGAGNAIYFSRSVIPYPRDADGEVRSPGDWLLHLGIYAYRREFLFELTQAPPADLERVERLEQLRALHLGAKIAVAVVDHASTGVDTPQQYAEFVQRYQARVRSESEPGQPVDAGR